MKKKITVILTSLMIVMTSVFMIIDKDDVYSESERRKLTTLNDVRKDITGNMEEYLADQFPLRDIYRSIKAYFSTYILNKSDNNSYFMIGDYVSKMDTELNYSNLKSNLNRIMKIGEKYCTGNKYIAIIPDKNYYLDYPTYDYDELFEYFKLSGFEYIDVSGDIQLEDFYYTDQHLRQEETIDMINDILSKMDHELSTDYEINELDYDFYGTYSGQIATKTKADKIRYVSNKTIDSLVAYDYLGNEISIYDFDKLDGNDAYEFFLSGNNPIVFIDNALADNDDTLVVFRDSFGSAIAPLLSSAYKKTVLVDLRLVNENILDEYIDFEGADVLILYSTLIINGVN